MSQEYNKNRRNQVPNNQVLFFQDDASRFDLLDDTTKSIINVIISHLNHFKMRVCWPSYDRIGRLAGCSASTVKRRMRWLRETGILTITLRRNRSNGHRRSHLYVLDDIFYSAWHLLYLRSIFPALWFSLKLLAPSSRRSDRGLSTFRDPICLYKDFFIFNNKHSQNKKRVKKSSQLTTKSTKDPTKGMTMNVNRVVSPAQEKDFELEAIMNQLGRTLGVV